MLLEPSAAHQEVVRLIDSGQLKQLSVRLKEWADPELADLIESLKAKQQILVFRLLARQQAAHVFALFEPEHQDRILRALTDVDTRALLASLSPDDRTALLDELPAAVTKRLMQLLSPEDLAESRQLLGYPDDSVGRMMNPDYIRVRAEWTVEQALAHIRKFARDSEVFNILYVTDGEGVLVDVLRMRRLILAPLNTVLSELLNYRFFSLSAYDDQEFAVEQIQRYDVNALPVVDSDGVLLGIVTVDDLFDVAEEEATEDIQKGAAVSPLETNYSSAVSLLLFRKRIGWLIILIFVNLLSAAVISNYLDYLQAYVALVLFMPLVIASGGNTGAQSATLMVRALAVGDLKFSGWIKVLAKELKVGSMLAMAMGFLAFVLGIYRSESRIALTVGLSMFFAVFFANMIGALLPLMLKKFKIDPAAASSPLVTSIM
ncbi:MAG: magnesium transporter, partial [Opitutales bacterium]